jgi:ERF superfamily
MSLVERPAPTMVADGDTAPQLPALTAPMQMLQLAVDRGASLDVLTKLMDLQERLDATQARREFDAAMSAVKADVGIIKKTGVGHNKSAYATLADIAGALDPVIALHGLSYRYRTQRLANELVVTCIVCHRTGHYEENSLPGPLDTSGNKTTIQAVGSTCTYLQRYTLIQAFGLAASVNGGEVHDDDGAAGIKNGWPRGIHEPDDYAGGTPNKNTKPAEQKVYSRNPAWVQLQTELDTMVEAGAGPVEISEWGSQIEHKIRNWPPEPKRQWISYVAKKMQEVVDNGIEHQGELTHEDAPQTISERAIEAREQQAQINGRPSRRDARPANLNDDPDSLRS